jgi:hypothetical protein
MPGRAVSSLCLLRQVSPGLSRNCRNEPRPDVEDAWFCRCECHGMAIAWIQRREHRNTGLLGSYWAGIAPT